MKNQKLTLEIVKHIFKLNGLSEKENDNLKKFQIQNLVIDEYSFPMYSCVAEFNSLKKIDSKFSEFKIILLDISYETKEYVLFFNFSEWFGMDVMYGGDNFVLFKKYTTSWQDVDMKVQAQMIIGFEDLCNFPIEWRINEKISEEELKMIKEFIE